MPGFAVEEYHIGWICALPKEMTAALSMLDEEHPPFEEQEQRDNNNYALGRIHKHNVVIACMPAGADGLVNAANVARDMARTFSALRVCFMVGIGGGVPNVAKGIDIRLGDVVVSQPNGTFGGVVQYDKGKAESDGKFILKGQLNQPPQVLLQTLSRLRAEHDRRNSWVPYYIKTAIERNPRMIRTGYTVPTEPDHFFCSGCDQPIEDLATDCNASHKAREYRADSGPSIHYGIIASANTVVKDAEVRDFLRERFGALCIEMEAAGLMNHFPCLVIRGICDYADSHKNDKWHGYAAMTAAAYAKEFLYYTSAAQASQEKPVQQVLSLLGELSRTSTAQLDVSRDHLQIAKGQLYQSQTQYDNYRYARCHQAFKTSLYEDFKDVNPPRLAGTCQWVFDHPKYQEWRKNITDDLLWISADPGCGKSVLAKSLIENELRSTETHSVCYFFFKDNDQQDSIATAFCAIIHQLFSQRPRLIRHAITSWDQHGSNISAEISEMWRVWLNAARDLDAHSVTCVFDALDECNQRDRSRIIQLLAEFYESASSSQLPKRQGQLKILVTSRPYDDIQRGFNVLPDNLPTIQLRGEDENEKISKEIDLVIQAQMVKLASDLKLDSSTTHKLAAKLLDMEHRTYLWLHLAIDDIYYTFRRSLRRSQQSINLVPSTVEQAYERILSRVSNQDMLTVKQILLLVVGARRPLTINEIGIALGIATSSEPKHLNATRIDPKNLGNRIRDLCGLFVFVNHSKVQLIHQTAKEFLICQNGMTAFVSQWRSCLDIKDIDRQMTRICVEFLCLEEEDEEVNEEVNEEGYEGEDYGTSFFIYATEYWHSHLRDSDLPLDDPVFTNILRLYDAADNLYNIWFPVYWEACRYGGKYPRMNTIQLAAFLGHAHMLRLILSQPAHPDVNYSDDEGRSALELASIHGHEEVAKLLLQVGAAVDARDCDEWTALHHASWTGCEAIVRLLLEAGADISAPCDSQGTALDLACASGREKVVRFLIEAGADISTQDCEQHTALHNASLNGNKEVVRLLIEAGATLSAGDKNQWTALHNASCRGHVDVVRILVTAGADVHARDVRQSTALLIACDRGREAIVKILLDKGADVNTRDHTNWTALHLASRFGHHKVAEHLLEAGADVNAQSDKHTTALHLASRQGYTGIVRILVQAGADIDALDSERHTASQLASTRGHYEVVQLLLAFENNSHSQSEGIEKEVL